MLKKTRESVRKKIVLAAIECTERKGIQSVTVRDIAKQADVNIASINYYFGSKEKLLDEMLDFTLNDTLAENVTEIEQAYTNPEQVIKGWLMDFLEGMMRFPNISKAHLYGPLTLSNYNGAFITWINGFCTQLAKKIAGLEGRSSATEADRSAAVQMVATVLFMGIMPHIFDDFLNADLEHSSADQERFIDSLMEHFLSNAGETGE